ncbi:flavodoxin domain-containing protein [Nocardia sp. IFM 10818]
MTQQPVLVAYGSKRGGTAEIAQWIGDSLEAAGITAEVRPAREVRSVDDYGAVILGGALYSGRWHRDARRFARHFAGHLRGLPVWLFGSGPLDDSADRPDGGKIFGANSARKVAERLDARGLTFFGGRLERTARGFPASSMAKTHSGDFRDRNRIQSWAKGIAAELDHG